MEAARSGVKESAEREEERSRVWGKSPRQEKRHHRVEICQIVEQLRRTRKARRNLQMRLAAWTISVVEVGEPPGSGREAVLDLS